MGCIICTFFQQLSAQNAFFSSHSVRIPAETVGSLALEDNVISKVFSTDGLKL